MAARVRVVFQVWFALPLYAVVRVGLGHQIGLAAGREPAAAARAELGEGRPPW